MIENYDVTKEEVNKTQLGSVNLLRFLAALFVMMYHYTFMFFERGLNYIDLPSLRSFFHYGYLGVDLFFIISGFVISLSVGDRASRDFIISRVTRLYPMLWLCATVTFIFFIVLGQYHYAQVDLYKYVTNLTMVPTLFKSGVIDGSYWSLTVELKFYAFIFVLILLGLFKHLKYIAFFIAGALPIMTFGFHLQFNWISYFVAGMIFYSIYKNKKTLKDCGIEIFFLILLVAVSIYYAVSRAPSLSSGYGVYFDPVVIATYVATFYVLFFFIATNKISIANSKTLTVLGAITYPVYLLHQEVGLMSFKFLEYKNINYIIAFIIVSFFIFTVSYLFLNPEKKLQAWIKGKLKIVLYAFKFNFKK